MDNYRFYLCERKILIYLIIETEMFLLSRVINKLGDNFWSQVLVIHKEVFFVFFVWGGGPKDFYTFDVL